MIVVDDEAGSPTIHRIASVVVTGELNGHRVVARDDELGTEHLGQPEVAATLSLRYRPLRDVLLPHDWQSRVPTERQQKSRAFHRAEDAVEGHRVARGGQAEGAQVSGEICDRPRFEGHRRRQTDIRVNRWWFGFADRRRNHRVVDQPEELMGAHRHVHTPRRSPGLQVGRRELSRSGAFRAIRRHLCHGPSTVSATRAASMPRHAESVFASRELGAPSLDESPGRHSPEALASIT